MQKLVLIVGPTGVGKSKVAMEIAKKFDGEIISGDAYQCYRELNIGSAKISKTEQEEIKHYYIDEFSYRDAANVKHFQQRARTYIEIIASKKRLPIVCGGTGLYIKALIYDYLFHEEEIDESYQQALTLLTNEELYTKLVEIDPIGSQDLHPNNRKRVLRALMMAHLGHKKSDVLAQQKHQLLYDVCVIGLTMPRESLYENINQRVNQMMEDGLKQEVFSLIRDKEDFSLLSMQGIGYKEWQAYYQKESSLEDTIARIQKNTRNFAKRQYTWFRNQMDVEWFDVKEPEFLSTIYKKIANWLE